jgi:hypothetical protein
LPFGRWSGVPVEPRLALVGLIIMAIGTVPVLAGMADLAFDVAVLSVSALFAVALLRRLWHARATNRSSGCARSTSPYCSMAFAP